MDVFRRKYGAVVWQLDLQLPVQSVPITTKVMSSNPVHGEVYSIQHYVIKFVSDLRQVGGFFQVPVTSGHVTDVTSGHVTSRHVTSGCSPEYQGLAL